MNPQETQAFGSWIQDGKIESNMLYNAHYFSCKYWTVALFSRAFPLVCLSCQFKRDIDSYEIPPPPPSFHIRKDLLLSLGTGGVSKTDDFSEKFQKAFDPPPQFRKIILQIIFNFMLKKHC